MSSYSFSRNGYNYFLVSDGKGSYQLHTDANYLQYLEVNEKRPGVITSITNGETVILTRGQKFEDKFVSKIERIDGNPPIFKIKLEKRET
jgi:hypothetical protein